MASKASRANSKHKPFILSLIIISFSLLILSGSFRKTKRLLNTPSSSSSARARTLLHRARPVRNETELPIWFRLVEEEMKGKKVRAGFVNIDDISDPEFAMKGLAKAVKVTFDHVSGNLTWTNFFPEWINEDPKRSKPTCPEIPMPKFDDYRDLDVIVAKVPCGDGGDSRRGLRDVFRLQVNLVVANLAVKSGRINPDMNRKIYVVFLGSCGPMVGIFRCDDLMRQVGDYWVYRPEQGRLKQKVLMPVGSCQLAPAYTETGKERWRGYLLLSSLRKANRTMYRPREAYATVLHSSEAYVCGAIALAQSIRRTGSTKDLVLLADDSIGDKSLAGLQAAGWKIGRIDRIRSPNAKKGAYNEWNYSKLRVWQLTQYDKVIFIDADLIVLRNIDEFFVYPQLSAAPNNRLLFNSGVIVIEPSSCVFEDLMSKSFELDSYNGGDQGFLNEFFTWWHRLPSRLNWLKSFDNRKDEERAIPDNLYTLHFLGLKPWMCYRDYDCNWDMETRHAFASDSANRPWWDVYDSMPSELQSFCGLTEKMDFRIRKWRGIAKEANLTNGHWKIKVTDSRRLHYFE
ncbi:putative UDP-glucuronate:xylan alpha-glucuronosyltransferase 4 [Syzygium oleosum]|uniref:putative UDP-glucuronate:xylan alpha-glucuronosyltransferase 4 n=1 Tax=Syzygium oleosum TaxID=219896 RepID=UPI0024BA42FF|nr:putative UDP-glucuronate:xylan alpha-glucuronosyltransferase 4 [Syzygium oleosum]